MLEVSWITDLTSVSFISSPHRNMISLPQTIAELDTTIDHSPAPIAKLTPFEQRFAHKSSIYGRVLHIKSLYASYPQVDEIFKTRREAQLSHCASPPLAYRQSFEKILSKINHDQDGVFGEDRISRFLDLGFSPGGFSNWLLQSNRKASGVGITLPDDEAGYQYVAGDLLATDRFTPVFANIITSTRDTLSSGGNPIASLIPGSADGNPSFDLIIGGAFPTLEDKVPWHQRVRLAISQLYIILSNLQNGGTAMFLVSTKPRRWQVEILSIFRTLFHSVQSAKGSTHRIRTSCYLICTGFQRSDKGEMVIEYLQNLRTTLDRLSEIAEEDPLAEGTQRSSTSMPHISGRDDDVLFEEEHQFTLGLFEPCWKDQYDAIRGHLKRILERDSGRYILQTLC